MESARRHNVVRMQLHVCCRTQCSTRFNRTVQPRIQGTLQQWGVDRSAVSARLPATHICALVTVRRSQSRMFLGPTRGQLRRACSKWSMLPEGDADPARAILLSR